MTLLIVPFLFLQNEENSNLGHGLCFISKALSGSSELVFWVMYTNHYFINHCLTSRKPCRAKNNKGCCASTVACARSNPHFTIQMFRGRLTPDLCDLCHVDHAFRVGSATRFLRTVFAQWDNAWYSSSCTPSLHGKCTTYRWSSVHRDLSDVWYALLDLEPFPEESCVFFMLKGRNRQQLPAFAASELSDGVVLSSFLEASSRNRVFAVLRVDYIQTGFGAVTSSPKPQLVAARSLRLEQCNSSSATRGIC